MLCPEMDSLQPIDSLSDGIFAWSGGHRPLSRIPPAGTNQQRIASASRTQPNAIAALSDTILFVSGCESSTRLEAVERQHRDQRRLSSSGGWWWRWISDRLQRNHQGCPMIRPLRAGSTSFPHSKWHTNNIRAFDGKRMATVEG